MTDRYTKIVLTVIAGALVYLCIVMTAFPAVQAQGTQASGRNDHERRFEAVIVGWSVSEPMPIVTTAPDPGADRAQRRHGRSRHHGRMGRECGARQGHAR